MTAPRLEFLDPGQLADHPENWKFHAADQLDVIRHSVDTLGWLEPMGTWNQRTGRLINGHARKGLYAGKGPVPIWVVDLSEEQEAEALAVMDPSGWTSVANKTRYDALLKSHGLLESTRDGVKALLKSVSRAGSLLEKPPAKPAEDESVEIPLDALWPSSNPWGIPDLDPNLQAVNVPYPVWTWGSIGQTRHMPGTWHFYTSDRKFEPLWKHPGNVLKSGPAAVVEPNFSTTDQHPMACSLWHIYRKRWLARYWQARGLRVFVDTNVDAGLLAGRAELGGLRPDLLGVPLGWRSYASRAHANRPRSLDLEWEVIQEYAAPNSPTFLVVGGGREVRRLAEANGWVWVPEQIQVAHGKPEDGA